MPPRAWYSRSASWPTRSTLTRTRYILEVGDDGAGEVVIVMPTDPDPDPDPELT